MTSTRTITVLAVAGAIAITGCSSSTSGHTSTPPSSGPPMTSTSTSAANPGSSSSSSSSAPAASSTPTTSSAPASGGFPQDLAGLGSLLNHGRTTVRTATLDLASKSTSVNVSGHGVEKIANGKLSALDLKETVGGGTQRIKLRIIEIGAKLYGQLPRALTHSAEPWVELSASSSQPTLRELYASFEQSIQSSQTQSIQLFAEASTNLRFLGTSDLGGDRVGNYSLAVVVSRLPATFPGRAALVQAGVAQIPLTLSVDRQGRPRRVTERITVAGQTTTVLVSLGHINEPVHIAAPPAGQVGH